MSDKDAPIPVTIFGRTYQLRGGGEQAYLEELAEFVDGKMREIAEGTGTADTLKLAILTCLNIADEYLAGESQSPSQRKGAEDKRLARMVTLLDEALAE